MFFFIELDWKGICLVSSENEKFKRKNNTPFHVEITFRANRSALKWKSANLFMKYLSRRNVSAFCERKNFSFFYGLIIFLFGKYTPETWGKYIYEIFYAYRLVLFYSWVAIDLLGHNKLWHGWRRRRTRPAKVVQWNIVCWTIVALILWISKKKHFLRKSQKNNLRFKIQKNGHPTNIESLR